MCTNAVALLCRGGLVAIMEQQRAEPGTQPGCGKKSGVQEAQVLSLSCSNKPGVSQWDVG